MSTLREKYLEAVKQASKPRKQLVSKSAVGPQIHCLQDPEGNVIGFAPVEAIGDAVPVSGPENGSLPVLRIDKRDVAKVVSVAKSAPIPQGDPNAVFDESPLMPTYEVQSIGVEDVSKGADIPESDSLAGIFPLWLQ